MIPQSQQNQLRLLGRYSYVWSGLYKSYSLTSVEMNKMDKLLDNQLVNNAVGCVFGAFIGDALGSYCQFRHKPFQKFDPQLDLTMQMPGKGTFNVRPGQFTDDSEMAAHMLEALWCFDPKKSLQDQQPSLLMAIAQQYKKWYNSNPFDIGMTTRNALNIIDKNLNIAKEDEKKGINIVYEQKLKYMFTKIELTNKNSCSNGSLMRITPMAYFISLLLDQEKKKNPNALCRDYMGFIKSQINMTHGNEEIFESSYAWVQLLVYIIARKRYNRTLKTTYENFVTKYRQNKIIGHWIEEALKDNEMIATQNQGWAKIAFTYGVRALKALSEIEEDKLSDKNYIKIIRHVISKAGDTDTNGAIVGGLVGAALGFKRLPEKYLFKQFQLQLDQKSIDCSKRGPFYQPRRSFYKLMKLAQKFYQQ